MRGSGSRETEKRKRLVGMGLIMANPSSGAEISPHSPSGGTTANKRVLA